MSCSRRTARTFVAVVLAVVPALTLSACSGSVGRGDVRSAEGSIIGLTVAGTPGTEPSVRIAAPLQVSRTQAQTVVAGAGAPVVVDTLFVLQLTMYDARTGKKAISTYDRGQVAMAVKDTDGTLFPALAAALVGVRQGSRVVMTVTPKDGYGAGGAPQYGIQPADGMVLVADVVSVPPTEVLPRIDGRPLTAPGNGLPRVLLTGGDPSGFDFRGVTRPGHLVVVPLVAGTGPRIRDDSLVDLHSLAQVWGASVPFDDTYPKEPTAVPIGTGKVIEAWERSLVGVRRGSRLLVIAPPDLAFKDVGNPPAVPGGATIAYVIDVLGVS